MKRQLCPGVVIFLSCCAFSLLAQEPPRLLPGIMTPNYVKLVSAKKAAHTEHESSGLVIGPHRVITAHHLYHKRRRIFCGTNPGKVYLVARDFDLMAVEFPDVTFSPQLTFASDVAVGDKLKVYANSLGLDGVYLEYIVAKVEARVIYVQPKLLAGTSGAAFYNQRGDLVGLGQGSACETPIGCDSGLGIIIPFWVVKPFVEQALNWKAAMAETDRPHYLAAGFESADGSRHPLPHP